MQMFVPFTNFHERSLFVLFVGAFIPLWILPSSFGGLAAGAFLIQFGVQGAWGVVRAFSLYMLWYWLPDSLIDSHPTRRDVTTCFPRLLPWCRISAW